MTPDMRRLRNRSEWLTAAAITSIALAWGLMTVGSALLLRGY